jgi:hypothetical protein
VCFALQILVSGGATTGVVLCVEKDGGVTLETPGARAACCTAAADALSADDCCTDTPLLHAVAVRQNTPVDPPCPHMVVLPLAAAQRRYALMTRHAVGGDPPGTPPRTQRTIVLLV